MGRVAITIFALFGLFLFTTMQVDTLDSFSYATGQVVKEDTTPIPISVEETTPITIRTTAACCSFIGNNVQEKTCYALNNYDCSFCAKVC